MIETQTLLSDTEESQELGQDDEVKITQTGLYYLRELITRFHYIELVLQDTPIYDDEKFDSMMVTFPQPDLIGEKDMRKRIKVAKLFLEYLKSKEIEDKRNNQLNNYSKAFDFQITSAIIERALEGDIRRIEKL